MLQLGCWLQSVKVETSPAVTACTIKCITQRKGIPAYPLVAPHSEQELVHTNVLVGCMMDAYNDRLRESHSVAISTKQKSSPLFD